MYLFFIFNPEKKIKKKKEENLSRNFVVCGKLLLPSALSSRETQTRRENFCVGEEDFYIFFLFSRLF
jgi:hypothetical protein